MIDMKSLNLRIARSRDEIESVFHIRGQVFMVEQKVPRSLECDSHDSEAKHVIMMLKGKPIGCARIRFLCGMSGKKAKLERIAILKSFRGRGLGKPLMEYIVRYCKRKGARRIYMHAQYHAKGFYEKTGFVPKGKPFIEADIRHIEMVYEGDIK